MNNGNAAPSDAYLIAGGGAVGRGRLAGVLEGEGVNVGAEGAVGSGQDGEGGGAEISGAERGGWGN